MAVVIPYVVNQQNYLLNNLYSWREDMFPCRGVDVAGNIDLILYVSRPDETWMNVVKTLDAELKDNPATQCFNEIKHIYADIPESKDVYGAGTLQQFYGIFDRDFLKLPAYDYIMYMEPDMRPVREMWLDKLYSELLKDHPFWSKGTMPRYGNGEVPHINGNAIYRYNDPEFLRYVCDSNGAFKAYASFDQSLQVYREQHKLYHLWHKFIYTDAFQNLAEWEFDFHGWAAKHPNTFLVHGKGICNVLHRTFENKYELKKISINHVVHDVQNGPDGGANVCRLYPKRAAPPNMEAGM